MHYPCIEATIDVASGDRSLRVWIDRTACQDLQWDEGKLGLHTMQLRKWLDNYNNKTTIIGLVRDLIPDSTAIQVRDADGIGLVVYFVEFAEKG